MSFRPFSEIPRDGRPLIIVDMRSWPNVIETLAIRYVGADEEETDEETRKYVWANLCDQEWFTDEDIENHVWIEAPKLA